MISWPCARRSAATADESTPPDIATAMVSLSFWVAWGMMFLLECFSFYFRIFSDFERLARFRTYCPQTNA
jgi:hypothetical protein